MSDAVGYYPLPVIPVIRDIDKSVNRQMAGPLAAFGRKAGADTGKAFASGLESAKARVQSASSTLAKARRVEEDAAGRVRTAEARLEAARNSGKTDRIVAAEEALGRVRRASVAATESAANATRELAQAQNAASAAGVDGAGRVSGAFGGLLGKLKMSPATAAKFGAAFGAAGATAIGALVKIGATFDDLSDSLRVATGASGDDLDSLVESAKNVGRTVPASFGDIGSVLGQVRQRLGLTGTDLEAFTGNVVNAGRLLGQTIDVNALSGAFNAFGVQAQDMSGALDSLWRSSRASGIGFDDMVASVEKGAPALKQFGFGIGESAALVGLLDKSGLDASKTIGGLTKGLAQFAKDGRAAPQALSETVAEIQRLSKAGNETGALALSNKLFGAKGGAGALEAIKSGALSVGQLQSALASGGDTIAQASEDTADFAERWELLKNRTLIAIEPIATRVFGAITTGMDMLTNSGALETFAGYVGSAFTALGSFGDKLVAVGNFFNQNKDYVTAFAAVITTALLPSLYATSLAFARQAAVTIGYNALVVATKAWTAAQWLLNVALNANPVGLIITGLVALGAAIILAYRRSETFRNIVQGAWNGIKVAAQVAWTQVLQPTIKGIWDGMQWVGEKATWLWRNVFEPTWEGIKTAFTVGWDIISLVIEKIRGGMQFLGDTVSGIASGIGDAFRGAFNGVVAVLKAPLKLLGMFLSAVPTSVFGIEIPGAQAVKNWGQTLQGLKGGGTIAGRTGAGVFYGPGSGTSDSLVGVDAAGIPTVRVSKGEGVVNADSMGRGGSVLVAALNAGWVPSPEFLHGLVGLAEGGVVGAGQLVDFARGVEGVKYVWGGVNWGDCSGAVSALANFATGRAPFASRFATATEQGELAKRGFKSGLGPAGSLNVGWSNGGPGGGHTAATLPNGTNFEMGGKRGNGQFGGAAVGAGDSQFTQHAHLPPEFFTGLDGGAPTYGGGKGLGKAGAGSASGGLSGGGGGRSGGSGGGSTSGGGGGSGSGGGGGLGALFGGGGGSGGASGGGGGDLGDLIKIFGGGILETFGIDGSWLPDIRELGVVKMADAIAGIKPGQSPESMELPQGAPPIGAGAGDGAGGGASYDASVTINGNVGYTPEQVQGISEKNQNRLRGRTPVGG